MKKFFALFVLAVNAYAMDNLRVAFQWKQLDFDFPSDEAREEAVRNKEFIQENNLPLGLEVYGDRLFITVPRWKAGVPASLTYINLSDPMDSPKLKPYPSWEAHRLPQKGVSRDPPEIVSPFRVRADQCGRLWVLDTGVADLLGDTHAYSPAQLVIYDLHNDALLRRYAIPEDFVKDGSFFATLAVEDYVCDDTYAYVADLGSPALIVYSWQKQRSWRVKHNYFNIEPTAGEFNVSGVSFQWEDGLFGLALSAPQNDGFSTLYFHPMVSTNEFSVSTKYLRDESLAKNSYHEFKYLGDRGQKGQSGVSFLDKNTGVLFYALLNLNAIACWKTMNPSYTMRSQGRVYMSNETMVFPNDIKVDSRGNLWVLSDRLPTFMYGSLNRDDVNFRILTATVEDAIKGTACDRKLVFPTGMSGRPKEKPEVITGRSGATAKFVFDTSTLLFAAIFMLVSRWTLRYE